VTPRIDPIAEPRLVSPRPRRQIVPVLHVEATPDPIDDETREWCAVETPAIVRRAATTSEAMRAYVDSVALDPAHGIAQSDAMRDARRRRAGVVAAQAVRDLDGAAPPMTVATLVLDALERDGVL